MPNAEATEAAEADARVFLFCWDQIMIETGGGGATASDSK